MDVVALLAETQSRYRIADGGKYAAVYGKCDMVVIPSLAGELFDIEVYAAPVKGRTALYYVLYLKSFGHHTRHVVARGTLEQLFEFGGGYYLRAIARSQHRVAGQMVVVEVGR